MLFRPIGIPFGDCPPNEFSGPPLKAEGFSASSLSPSPNSLSVDGGGGIDSSTFCNVGAFGGRTGRIGPMQF